MTQANDTVVAQGDAAAQCPFMTQEGWDFTNPDMMEEGVPQEEFAQLRKTAPVWWNAQLPGKGDSMPVMVPMAVSSAVMKHNM